MKKLPIELYQLCIGIVHRLICYEKKSNVRIAYNWKELWEVLIMLLKFVVANENHLSKKVVILNFALQVSFVKASVVSFICDTILLNSAVLFVADH